MTETAETHSPSAERKPTAFEITYRHVTEAIPPYKSVLRSDAEDRVSQLGTYSKRLLTAHLSQLDNLKALLDRFKANQGLFKRVDQRAKLLETRDFPRQLFTARFAPINEPIPLGSEKPQIQLGFHGNISANDPETISEAYYALGLSTEPAATLQKVFRQATEQSINVNAVSLYIDPETHETKLSPHGGITFRWRRGEDRARVGGFVYVGLKPHVVELQRAIPLEDFAAMQRMVVHISGFTTRNKTAPFGGK